MTTDTQIPDVITRHGMDRVAPQIQSEPLPWMADAACRHVDNPELFFPQKHNGAAQAAAAKRICRGCPAVVDCLHYAMRTHDAHAVLGGTTARERQRIRVRQTRRA